jgi:hypothetical protein
LSGIAGHVARIERSEIREGRPHFAPLNAGYSCDVVMPGLVPGIHVFLAPAQQEKTWMAGTKARP